MKKSFTRVAIVEAQGKPTFVGFRNGTMYWGCGLSHCREDPEMFPVLRELAYESDDDLDALELEFLKECCPPAERPSARLGWLGPKGEWHPCGYCAHKHLARLLSARYYDSFGGEGDLEKHRWLNIDGIGGASRGYTWNTNDITPALPDQIRAFERIVEAWEQAAAEGADLKQLCLDNPERFPCEMWWTSPAENPESFLRYMRQSFEELAEGKL